MEQETHTRLLFPGAFAIGAFLWLAYFLGTMPAILASASKELATMLSGILITVPTVSLIADRVVYTIVGGYFGRVCRWSFRWLGLSHARVAQALIDGSYTQKESDMWTWRIRSDLGISETRSRDELIGKMTCPNRLERMSADVRFTIAALKGTTKDRCKSGMPEDFVANSRRRWTAVWASWNSAAGIFFGITAYFTNNVLYGPFTPVFPVSLWHRGLAISGPLLVVILLWLRGRDARRQVWDLELAWVIMTRQQQRNMQQSKEEC